MPGKKSCSLPPCSTIRDGIFWSSRLTCTSFTSEAISCSNICSLTTPFIGGRRHACELSAFKLARAHSLNTRAAACSKHHPTTGQFFWLAVAVSSAGFRKAKAARAARAQKAAAEEPGPERDLRVPTWSMCIQFPTSIACVCMLPSWLIPAYAWGPVKLCRVKSTSVPTCCDQVLKIARLGRVMS